MCETAFFRWVQIRNRTGQKRRPKTDGFQRVMCPVVWCVSSFQRQNWHRTNMSPVLTIDRTGQWHDARCLAGRCAVRACLCCPWVLPLGCRAHCHSNCCHADSSCTSLKLIASHSIHFTNMCGNYYFARVIKWESIRNERGETANIPGITAPTLIMIKTELPSLGRLCPDPVIWKEETGLDWCWQLWAFQTNMLIQMNQQ